MTPKHASSPDSGSAGRQSRSWSRVAIKFSSVLVFAVWYRLTGNMMAAIGALVVASAAAVVAGLFLERTIAPLPFILGLVPTVTGTFSLLFDNPGIVTEATTVVHGVLCVVMLGGLAFGANPLKLMFGKAVDLADGIWWHLALRLGSFAMGIVFANEIIQHTQSNAVWVAFKFPGVPLLHALFWVAQRRMLRGRQNLAETNKSAGSCAASRLSLEAEANRGRL
jgi:intracellular septation protein